MKIGFIGDTHGYQYGLERALEWLVSSGIKKIYQVGDFGFLWPGADQLEWVDKTLAKFGISTWDFYVIPGNHEDHAAWPLAGGDDGAYLLQRMEMVDMETHREEGWRWRVSDVDTIINTVTCSEVKGTVTTAVVLAGGAPSVDRYMRREGKDWWPEEMSRQDTRLQLHSETGRAADHRVYVTHDAPIQSTTISRMFPPFPDNHPRAMYGNERTNDVCLAHRRRLGRGYESLCPNLAIHGHYHVRYTEETEHGLVVGLGDSSQDLSQYVCFWDTNELSMSWPENNKTRRTGGRGETDE